MIKHRTINQIILTYKINNHINMKKAILFVIFGALSISFTYAQTHYYQQTESTDRNGAKRKGSGGAYLTFTSGKKACYLSDDKGYSISGSSSLSLTERIFSVQQFLGSNAYRYIKTQNGTHVFDDSYTMSYGGVSMPVPATSTIYFNSDFTKLIVASGFIETQYHFEKTNGPYDDSVPLF